MVLDHAADAEVCLSCRIAAAAGVTRVYPVTGPTWGNTTVTVFGYNFQPAPEFSRCTFFGSAPVYASFVTSTELLCVSPPQSAGTVTLEVSNNNQDYTLSGVVFTYQSMFRSSSFAWDNCCSSYRCGCDHVAGAKHGPAHGRHPINSHRC